jgi:hypothetical protein
MRASVRVDTFLTLCQQLAPLYRQPPAPSLEHEHHLFAQYVGGYEAWVEAAQKCTAPRAPGSVTIGNRKAVRRH